MEEANWPWPPFGVEGAHHLMAHNGADIELSPPKTQFQ